MLSLKWYSLFCSTIKSETIVKSLQKKHVHLPSSCERTAACVTARDTGCARTNPTIWLNRFRSPSEEVVLRAASATAFAVQPPGCDVVFPPQGTVLNFRKFGQFNVLKFAIRCRLFGEKLLEYFYIVC